MIDHAVLGPVPRFMPSPTSAPPPSLAPVHPELHHSAASTVVYRSAEQLPPFRQVLHHSAWLPDSPLFAELQHPDGRSGTQHRSLVVPHASPPAQAARAWNAHETPPWPPDAAGNPSSPSQSYAPGYATMESFHPPPASRHFSPPSHPPIPPFPGRQSTGEALVHGQGLCYIYSDGTYCPKSVNGAPVNPHFGLTRAGKPRKRLAQACTTCRDKKIRCSPSTTRSKCLQCSRFDRECNFALVPASDSSGEQRTPSVSSPPSQATSVHRAELPRPPSHPPLPPRHAARAQSSPMSVDSLLSPKLTVNDAPASPGEELTSKRPKLRFGSSSEFRLPPWQHDAPKRRHSDFELRPSEAVTDPCMMQGADPFQIDPKTTEMFLDAYFLHVNSHTYYLFPRRPWMTWVKAEPRKSWWDKILIYAMMAHGALFLPDPAHRSKGVMFAKIAREAVAHSAGYDELPVVQARLVIALLDFATDNCARAWDHCGSAIRTACGMKLDVEEEAPHRLGNTSGKPPFGFDGPMLRECRRRTYWCAYIMDRFSAFCHGYPSVFDPAGSSLRLPCDEDMYESGRMPATPFLQSEVIRAPKPSRRSPPVLGTLAYLVHVASIWGDVLTKASRCQYDAHEQHEACYERFYQDTMDKLRRWQQELMPHLVPNAENTASAIKRDTLGTYLAMHTLHHCTVMQLARHVNHEDLDRGVIARNVAVAHAHAIQTLQVMQTVASHTRASPASTKGFLVAGPFAAVAVASAMDILTAAGLIQSISASDSPLTALMNDGIEVMRLVAEHWHSAQRLLDMVTARYDDVFAAIARPAATTKWAYGVGEPMEKTFKHDLIYAISKRQYLQALGNRLPDTDDEFMLEVGKREPSTPAAPITPSTWGKPWPRHGMK